MITLKDLIKDNQVIFDSYRAGFFYYNITTPGTTYLGMPLKHTYQFTVPIEDVGNVTLLKVDKAITFMRWIRKAMNNNELIKVN